MPVQSPTELDGRYVLGPVLGWGASATVHRAYDRVLDRNVALKLFHDSASSGEVGRARDEMRLLALLDHPHLVTIHDAGPAATPGEGARPYLVMELVDGPTLAARLLQGPMPAEEVARIGAEVADALAHVHARGLVHRDVKPANLLLGSDGRTRLTDFGIARALDTTLERSARTAPGFAVGTAAYLSPEQVRGEPLTPASDVYALGLVLLESLTGRRAYPGDALASAVARLRVRPEVPAGLPDGWGALLEDMTADDPSVRPTAGQVRGILGAAARPAEVAPAADTAAPLARPSRRAPAPARTRPVPVSPSALRRPRRALLLAAAALALATPVALVVASGDPAPVEAAPVVAQPPAPSPALAPVIAPPTAVVPAPARTSAAAPAAAPSRAPAPEGEGRRGKREKAGHGGGREGDG